jgi:prepilin-type N-terminal cleavage/methylation domain-containing protein/prepilin-type processing-associated H-X9-DG protein
MLIRSVVFLPAQRRHAFSLVELLVVLALIAILLALTLSGIQKVRAAAARTACQNNMRQIALAVHAHQAQHGAYPPGTSHENGKSPMPFLGWQARLLPFLEQADLWKETVKAFAQEPNFLQYPPHIGLRTPQRAFCCPLDSRGETAHELPGKTVVALTAYLGVAGLNAYRHDGVLYLDSDTRPTDIKDGSSHTLLFGERPASANLCLGWWYAGIGQNEDGDGEVTLGVRAKNVWRYGRDCAVGPYHFTDGDIDNLCDTFHFWSLHAGGASFAFCDGSVRFLRYDADPLMPALASRAGGESVAIP